MNGLFAIDQYGNKFGPLDPTRPKASLLECMVRKTAVPMYRDKRDGTVARVGYVVSPTRGRDDSGTHWCRLVFVSGQPWEKPV